MNLPITHNVSINDARAKGYDSGLNGASTTNCHFSLFATPELTKAWEEGNRHGKEEAKRRKRDLRDRR